MGKLIWIIIIIALILAGIIFFIILRDNVEETSDGEASNLIKQAGNVEELPDSQFEIVDDTDNILNEIDENIDFFEK